MFQVHINIFFFFFLRKEKKNIHSHMYRISVIFFVNKSHVILFLLCFIPFGYKRDFFSDVFFRYFWVRLDKVFQNWVCVHPILERKTWHSEHKLRFFFCYIYYFFFLFFESSVALIITFSREFISLQILWCNKTMNFSSCVRELWNCSLQFIHF